MYTHIHLTYRQHTSKKSPQKTLPTPPPGGSAEFAPPFSFFFFFFIYFIKGFAPVGRSPGAK